MDHLQDLKDQDGLVELTVERLGIYGEGVARLDGLTVFVDGVLPQEKVSAHVFERRRSFAKARALSLLQRSPHRIKPSCPLFERCGGCQLMHLSEEQQLEAKRLRVADALQRIGKLNIEVDPCIRSPQTLGYRNKIQLPMSANLTLGLYAKNTHHIVEIEHCQIHCPLGEKVLGHVQHILKKHPKAKEIKAVLIKTAVHTHQVLLALVTKSNALLTDVAEQVMHIAPEVKGVVQNFNPSETNTVLGNQFKTIAGQGWIEEKLCGLWFKVSPASFFQVNPAQAEALYEKVLQLGYLSGEETVLDAFCGVGTLALIFAKKTKKVIGIEIVPQAIVDAEENALRNGIENTTFLCGKAEEKISLLKEIDVAILNPPRKGCESALLKALIAKRVERILYVSCDPATLARDLSVLCNAGYKLASVQPFDMFPQTMHVECVASLQLPQ
jgi:23S rRNA (uracil1939-C5)-methyltransferase